MLLVKEYSNRTNNYFTIKEKKGFSIISYGFFLLYLTYYTRMSVSKYKKYKNININFI